MRIAAAIAAALAGGTASADVMLSDFESGTLDGWQNYSGNPIANVEIGGSKTMQLTINNQYWGQSVMQDWSNPQLTTTNFNANSQLEFDVWIPSSYTWGGLAYHAELQSAGDPNWSGADLGLNVALKDAWQHVVYDYSAGLPRTGAMTNLVTWFNPGWGPDAYTAQVIYIDNIKLTQVPEPAALGLLSVGGIALIRRRRA
jgi:MYXO-CTERM domain-containing protein